MEESKASADFDRRFGIVVDVPEAQSRFRNRLDCLVFGRLTNTERSAVLAQYHFAVGARGTGGPYRFGAKGSPVVFEAAAAALEGIEWVRATSAFPEYLRMLELAYEVLPEKRGMIDRAVQETLRVAEAGLGLRWDRGAFWPRGAPALDDPLRADLLAVGLEGERYKAVAAAYAHGLSRLVQAGSDADALKDAVTNLFEALEAMAKAVTGRDETLHSNEDRFAKAIGLSGEFRAILTQTVAFGNKYRHADLAGRNESHRPPRPALQPEVVEAYSYLIGLFIKLASESPSAAGQADGEAR